MDKIKKKYTIYMRDQADGKTRISYERLDIIILFMKIVNVKTNVDGMHHTRGLKMKFT